MATLMIDRRPSTTATARESKAAQDVSTVVRVNRVPISTNAAVARMPGPSGNSSPLSAITYIMTNGTGGTLTYVMGDPTGLIAGAFGAAWTQPSSVKNGAVAAIQTSFASSPIAIKGLNYVVSDATQYSNALMYRTADRDGRLSGQPINIDAVLRNTQYIATRQTIDFEEPYGMHEFGCFTLAVAAGVTVTMTLFPAANAA